MGTSLYADYLKSQQAPSPGSLYAQYLATQGPVGPAGHDFHAEYKSGALAKRMADANARDAANLADEQSANGETALDPIASHLANLASGIPGVEAAQAFVRSKARGEPYAQSLTDLRESAKTINPVARYGEKMLGAAPLAALLPGSPAIQGAILGGADQALAADPESLGRRAFNTAAGAGVGAAVGKLVDVGTSAVKAGFAKNPQANILARQADRAASAAKLYGAAQTEGEMNGANTAVRQFIQEPEVASRIEALQALEQYKNTPADSPQMMRALARSMSDEAKTLNKGMAVTDPSKPNTLREKAASLSDLKKRLINTVSNPSEKPPLHLDVAEQRYETDPLIESARPRLEGPTPRVSVEPPSGETPAQQMAREALQRRSGLAAARQAGSIEGQAVEEAGNRPVIRPPAEQPTPEFVVGERQERVLRPGIDVTTPAMRVQTAPAEAEPAMMPSFREASQDFARRSSEIDALRKGMGALQGESGQQRPTPNNVISKNPKTLEAFANWAQTGGSKGGPVAPGELQAAREGVLGDLSNSWRYEKQGIRMAPFRHDAAVASKLLRAAPDKSQSLTDLLQSLGLTSLNTPFTSR